jgi:hypothetical protein
MSQTFFSKLDQAEKDNRLSAIASSRGRVTVWIKGQKEKHLLSVVKYDVQRGLLVLDTKDDIFPNNAVTLCSFEFRGMNFFSQTTFLKSVGDFACLKFDSELYKSEKRTSYRLMTFPLHEVWAIFNLEEGYQGGKVIDFRTKQSSTGLFNKFLNLVEGDENDPSALKIRVQDLSTTGMALHIGELESKFFPTGAIFKNVRIKFVDEEVIIPETKIVYAVNFIGSDKNLKKLKLGVHFEKLPNALDHLLGKKINNLLRESDHNKDFENFKK